MTLELRAHRLEIAEHHLSERLGVEPLAEAHRTLEIGEDDGYGLPEFLGGSGAGTGAEGAPASAVPQKPHRRNRSGFSSPQFGQICTRAPETLDVPLRVGLRRLERHGKRFHRNQSP